MGAIRLTGKNGDDYDGGRVETSLEMISDAIRAQPATPLADLQADHRGRVTGERSGCR